MTKAKATVEIMAVGNNVKLKDLYFDVTQFNLKDSYRVIDCKITSEYDDGKQIIPDKFKLRFAVMDNDFYQTMYKAFKMQYGDNEELIKSQLKANTFEIIIDDYPTNDVDVSGKLVSFSGYSVKPKWVQGGNNRLGGYNSIQVFAESFDLNED